MTLWEAKDRKWKCSYCSKFLKIYRLLESEFTTKFALFKKSILITVNRCYYSNGLHTRLHHLEDTALMYYNNCYFIPALC